MQNDNSHGSCASVTRGIYRPLRHVGDGARRDGLAGGGGALRLCREWYNASTVSVIDTASNTVVATIPVGSGPLG